MQGGCKVNPFKSAVGLIFAIALVFLVSTLLGSNVVISTYNLIWDEATPLARRQVLRFNGAGVAAADSGGQTVVTIPGGGGVSAGNFASVPACTTSSFVYSVSTSPLVGYCDGASGLTWRAFGVALPSLPVAASLTEFNGAVWSQTNGSVLGTLPGVAGQTYGLGGASGASPPVTVTAHCFARSTNPGDLACGVFLRNSANSRLISANITGTSSTGFLQTLTWVDFGGGVNAVVNNIATQTTPTMIALRLDVDAGGTITSSISYDGNNFIVYGGTTTVATYLSAIDQAGMFAYNSTAGTLPVTFYSLEITH
jgi:hypothetical protein